MHHGTLNSQTVEDNLGHLKIQHHTDISKKNLDTETFS